MKRLTRTLPVFLAAALQVMPILRNFFINPASAPNFAFILRWGIGTTAFLGAVDAVSGATSTFTTPGTFSGSAGNAFSNNVTISIGGGNQADSSDYFIVSTASTSSPTLTDNQTTTVGMPPGLTFKSSWVNGASTIGGVIFGTPTTAGSYPFTVTCVSPGNAQLSQNITITISGSTGPVAPSINTPPAPATILAGKNATFTVTASGTAPLGYFWLKNGTALADGGNVSGSATATLGLAAVTTNDAANYSVIVSNSVGSITSSVAALTVVIPPSITLEPAPQTVTSGNNALFTVSAAGSAPLTYRWLKNSAAITNGVKYSGVATSALTVTAAAATDAGNYSVVVTNLGGSITSSVAALIVMTAPTITTPPASLTVINGSNASFTVTAAGSTPLYYEWLKNGSPMSDGGNVNGSSTASLNLSPVSTADVATYSVMVSNSVGTATSSGASLTVIVPPAITSGPTPQAVATGGTATFTVTATGTAPLAYQWLKNGATITTGTKYSGVTTSTLTVTSVTNTDVAGYSVIVTNAGGSVTSASAALTVVSSPTILSPPASQVVAVGASVSFTVTAAGSAPLYYEWLKNGAPMTDGGNVSGSATPALSLSSVSSSDATSYSVIISNSFGTVTSPAATLAVDTPPSIITPPAPATIDAGSNVTFIVTAAGTAPLGYHWLKNGAPVADGGAVSGSASAALMLTGVSSSDAASYSVTVTNPVGSVTSSSAVLTVLMPPAISTQPAGSSVALGSNATFSVTASGTAPLSYLWFKDGNPFAVATTNVLTLTAVSTNDAAAYSVVITNLAGAVTSSNAVLTVVVPPAIVSSPAAESIMAGSNAAFTVTASGSEPLTYQWLKNGVSLTNGGNVSGANTAMLTLSGVTAADVANYSVTVANLAGSAASSPVALTVLFPPAIVTPPASQFGAAGSVINLSVTASGTAPLSYQWFDSNGPLTDGADFSGSATSALTITSLNTNELGGYYVVVNNSVGVVTSAVASVSINVAPIITAQPVGQTLARSNAVSLTVVATGSSPLSYQWRRNGTNLIATGNISGVSSPTLDIASALTNNSGNYSVVVTNDYGSATSSIAVLNVLIPPSITQQPTNRVARSGTNVTFSVAASGSGPLAYQWSKDGQLLADGGNISGSATGILTVSAVSSGDAGTYSVTVSNAVGAAASSGATLTIFAAPVIVSSPANQNVVVSNSASFSVAATGTAPLHYQWFLGATAIKSATNSVYTLASARPANAGSYSVTVTNPAGKAVSPAATLTVYVPPTFTLQASNRAVKLGTNTWLRAAVSGTAPLTFQWFKDGVPLADGGDFSGSTSNVLEVAISTTNDAGAYSLSVSNLAGVIISSNALLSVLLPPAIVTEPENQTVAVSNNAVFSVSAVGGSLHYQWRKGLKAIRGATNALFQINHVTTADATNYSVVVSNRIGVAVSSSASLVVVLPPVFTLQAGDRTVRAGSNTVFSAAVQGGSPFSYQWYKNGLPLSDGGNISGSQTGNLTVSQVSVLDDGFYYVTVANLAGAIQSSNATLSVQYHSGGDGGGDNSVIQPSVTAHPFAFTQIMHTGAGFTLKASGAAGSNYVLQASADLIHWSPLQTNTAGADGSVQFSDPAPTVAPARFYRLTLP